MKGSKYFETFRGSKLENKYSRYVILGLTLTVLILAFQVTTRKQTVVQIPPGLTAEGKIMPDNASESVKKAWGTFFALALGNVTPRSADFTARVLSPHISSAVHKRMMELIAAETKTIKDQSISVSFTPTDVFYVPSTKKVVVTGQFVIHGLRDNGKTSVKTYVMGVNFKNYMVTLTSIDTYTGSWRPPAPKDS